MPQAQPEPSAGAGIAAGAGAGSSVGGLGGDAAGSTETGSERDAASASVTFLVLVLVACLVLFGVSAAATVHFVRRYQISSASAKHRVTERGAALGSGRGSAELEDVIDVAHLTARLPSYSSPVTEVVRFAEVVDVLLGGDVEMAPIVTP